MTTKDRPTALITGASGGIGEALARELAAQGHNLILVARSVDALDALGTELAGSHGITSTTIGADLAQSGAGRALAAELQTRGLGVDVVVNNAGFADFGEFAHAELDKTTQMLTLNIATLTELTHELLAPMLERGTGRVLNVASTAAFLPGPLMAVYYATKAYVLSFSEAIAEELKGTGVTVTALCPGPTASGFQARAAMEDSKLVKGKKVMDAATVAKIGVAGMMAGKPVVICGFKNKVQAVMPRFLPRRMVPGMVKRAQAASS
jgi:short-subunit dehydrogenase